MEAGFAASGGAKHKRERSRHEVTGAVVQNVKGFNGGLLFQARGKAIHQLAANCGITLGSPADLGRVAHVLELDNLLGEEILFDTDL
jgi:hypothetical protein